MTLALRGSRHRSTPTRWARLLADPGEAHEADGGFRAESIGHKPKVAPDMDGAFFVACYGGWLGEKTGGQFEKNRQYLYCSGFKIVELITEGPDRDSVLVVEHKGHEEEARVYRASQRLNHPQNAAQFLESLPGGLYRSGTGRVEMR